MTTSFLLLALALAPAAAQAPSDADWARITEDERAIQVETDKLEAVILKRNPEQWMTGIEQDSFLDKTTGFREVGDGLMVIDWLMEAGSDEARSDQVIAPDGNGVGRYFWYTNETDPDRRSCAIMAHGASQRNWMVEGHQLCHRMKPVQPEIIRGKDFVAIKTTYKYEYAAPGRKTGSQSTQLIVFPKGARYFVLMDKIDSVNSSEEMFLRNAPPRLHPPRAGRHLQRHLSQLPRRPERRPHSVERVLHAVPARPQIRLPPGPQPHAGQLHPRRSPPRQGDRQARPLARGAVPSIPRSSTKPGAASGPAGSSS